MDSQFLVYAMGSGIHFDKKMVIFKIKHIRQDDPSSQTLFVFVTAYC